MLSDRQGNPVQGASAEALEHYEAAVRAFNIYRGDPLAAVDAAIAAAPDFHMASLFKAYLFGLATEPEATAGAAEIVEGLKSKPLDEREASHLAALDRLLQGNWTEAAIALDRHLARFPRDLVALQAGHLMDFFRGNARDLRDRVARALPAWTKADPDYPIVLGFYAFGLEEAGDYARAEDMGRKSLSMEPLDCWAHHAVAHVMEMQGRAQDGIGWMIAREPHWAGEDNFFQVHNWWHRALCHLDVGQPEEALALYDGPIRSGHSAVAVDLVDASALLWRLALSGQDLGDRWAEVAAAWDRHADGKLYPFNDWHAVMAYLGAGRSDDVGRILSVYRSNAEDGSEAGRWAREIGLPLVEGFQAYWQEDYPAAVERLHAARYIANAFGGSHAQRDVIDWTLTEAAIRGGMGDMAKALAEERLALKPYSRGNLAFLARAVGSA